MTLSPRHALARSYALTANLTAVVDDDGGAGRSVTIATSGKFVRAHLAASAWTGATSEAPLELFAAASSTLTAAAGGGAWAVALHTDGRTSVTWTGTGTGKIVSGPLLAALGFAAAVGPLASGASALSTYPALGLVLWAYSESDTGWLPEQDSARSRDSLGRLYSWAAAHVRWTRSQTAHWVPRAWASNAAGEYLSPAWSSEVASGGASTFAAPNPASTAAPTSWSDLIFALRGAVAFGHTDQLFVSPGEASTVYLDAPMLDAGRFALARGAENYSPRRDLLVSIVRTGTFSL